MPSCLIPSPIAIIGAGPAGISAAAAATTAGCRVILIDAAQRLGGSVTAALHRSLCGLYAAAPTSPLDTLNDGAQRDLVARMMSKAPDLVLPRQLGPAWVLEFPTSAWESALADICSEARVDLRLGTRVLNVRRDAHRIHSIQIAGRDPAWIDLHALIDCTGGGQVLQLIGDDVMQSIDPSPMLGGYAIRWADLHGDLEMLRLQTPYVLAQAVTAGSLPPAARFTVFHPGPGDAEGIVKLAIDPNEFSPEQVEPFVTAALDHLRRELPAFAAAKIIERSPHALRRDGRRLLGKTTVTESDVLTARCHGQGAVHAWWPIERWDAQTGPTYAYPPPGQHYDIPSEALHSDKLENLFAAGACLSATANAAASLRASGICLATGQLAAATALIA
jgi:2-polyprenyl-6-methoxyphenol hydroxylase-like FAD-dependent oxidoreductase